EGIRLLALPVHYQVNPTDHAPAPDIADLVVVHQRIEATEQVRAHAVRLLDQSVPLDNVETRQRRGAARRIARDRVQGQTGADIQHFGRTDDRAQRKSSPERFAEQ